MEKITNTETLYNAIIKHSERKPLRFHMPGHKGKNILGINNIAEIDLTEIKGLDNLHWPTGCIEESERLMAEQCGAERSFFIVNGSSAGIIAAVLTLTAEGDAIVCARNSHVSLFKGLCLSGAKPVYIMPEIITEYGICGGIEPNRVEDALKNMWGAAAVFITSPTFEGITSDIAQIAEIAHKYGAKLIVDEAHGAHFKFGRVFPETAISQGADIAVQSWHKTLTAFGQGAVLHSGGEIDIDKLRFYLSLMQTTSPSYAIMASIDRTRELLKEKGGALFEAYESNLCYLRERLSYLKNVRLMSGEIKGKYGVSDFDAGKITLFLKGGGKKLDEFLRSRDIFAEMSGIDHIVLITSLADERTDYDALINAVSIFDSQFDCLDIYRPHFVNGIPEMALTVKESMGRRGKAVEIPEAAGKISAGFITPYPPGIPITAPGEIITAECAEFCAAVCGSIEINGVIGGKYLKILE